MLFIYVSDVDVRAVAAANVSATAVAVGVLCVQDLPFYSLSKRHKTKKRAF